MTKQLLSGRAMALCLSLWFCCAAAWAQIPIQAVNSPYTQDFNTLANTGTSNVLPSGWVLTETGTSASADGLYAAGTGSSNAGNAYSFGAAGSTDRALGGLLSGTLTPTFGAGFVNNTSSTLTSIAITYTGEEWRLGTTARADSLLFQYSTNATSLATGSWTGVPSLNFGSPFTTTVGAVDGNAAANRQALTATISGLSLAPGATFWIRWNDYNASGADDGLAVDDFSLTAFGETSTPVPTLTVTPTTLNFGELSGSASAVKTVILMGENLTNEVSAISNGAGFSISKDSILFDSVLTFTTADLTSSKKIFVKFAPAAFGASNGNVTLTSTGAVTQTVTLSGAAVNPFEQNFNTCATALPGGWTQYSSVGAQTWACTTFGRTGNAVQINGFSGSALENVDWLISPALDLTGFTYPLLSYWTRTRFNGPELKLLVSTDYSGSGDPSLATWTELNGQFPLINSDVWTEASNVNLVDFKQANVHIAFLYTSSPSAEAARWTVDDFTLINSSTTPPPRLTTSITPLTDLYFESAVNVPSASKSISVTLSNATENLTVSVPAPFQISKDTISFASTVTFTVAELAAAQTLFIRSLPTTEGAFAGKLTFTSGTISSIQGYMTASSISKDKTFDVVTMNVEWFGHPSNGPSNNALQATNLVTLINRLDADVFTFQEISDINLFANSVAAQLPGYQYVYSTYVSNPETSDPYAQKLVILYKTATVTKLSAKALLTGVDVNNLPNYPDPDPTRFWASGRLPFVMDANVTINGISKRIAIVNIHARANSGADVSRYAMRAYDVKVLKDTLDAYYANVPVLIQGDYNDDVDSTVAPIPSPLISSYQPYSLDTANYKIATRVLSDAGLRSYITEANVIDHITMTNELFDVHLAGSTRIDYASNYIPDYLNTLSDHLPSTTRFKFYQAPTVAITKPLADTTILKGNNVVINATATDVDGPVARVEFYSNGALVGTDYTSPYSYTFTQPAEGTYSVIAQAFDQDNLSAISDSVRIKVVEEGIQGPACATVGKPYVYEIFTDASSVKSINWWVNGNATIVKDPSNSRKATITFISASSSSLTVSAGVNYTKTPWYKQFNKAVKIGGCEPIDSSLVIGVAGPACATAGQAYEYVLTTNPSLPVKSVSWWVSGSATIKVDPANAKRAIITFSQYNKKPVQVYAGVNYTTGPWYEQFSKNVQVGNCNATARTSAELGNETAITAYPNPTYQKVTISLGNQLADAVSLKVYDGLGKECMVSKRNVATNEVEIDLHNLASGLYLLRVQSADKTDVLRIVKK